MSDKPKFSRAVALAVARELCLQLADSTLRLEMAGSLRRGKAEVGDVELVYIPESELVSAGLFGDKVAVDKTAARLDALLAAGIIGKRRNVNGSEIWGPKNKLAFHCASGVPVDLFATTDAAWFNYLVCRTGGRVSNTAIAGAAIRKGWRWHPYGEGFTNERGELVRVTCEADAFALVGLPALPPEKRP